MRQRRPSFVSRIRAVPFTALTAVGVAWAIAGPLAADDGVTVFSSRTLNVSLTFNGFHGWETVTDSDTSSATGPWNGEASVLGASATENSTTGVGGATGTLSLSSYAPYPGASNSTWTSSTHSTKFVLSTPRTVSAHCDWSVVRELSGSAHFTFKITSFAEDFVAEDLNFTGVPAGTTEGTIDETVVLPAGAYFLVVNGSTSSPGPGLSGHVDLDVTFAVTLLDSPPSQLDVPGQFPSIGAAFAAANNGDTIRVASGTYHERLDFGSKRVSVVSASPSDLVIIDGDGTPGSLLAMTGGQDPSVVIRGITFRDALDGLPVPSLRTTGGGAVFLTNASPRIEACAFEGNHAGIGGAILAFHSAPEIVNCIFRGNHAATSGGAVMCTNPDTSKTIQISGAEFTCNTAVTGGAISAAGILPGDIAASDLTVCNNSDPQLVIAVPFPGSVVCLCPGDLDGDASVDADDLATLLGAWGSGASVPDVDCDGQVGPSDLAVLLGAWGSCF